jgi:hypothetical protein
MWLGHVFEVCERISEAQAILQEHGRGALPPVDALEKLQSLLSEPGLQEAMYNIGYFPKQSRVIGNGDASRTLASSGSAADS